MLTRVLAGLLTLGGGMACSVAGPTAEANDPKGPISMSLADQAEIQDQIKRDFDTFVTGLLTRDDDAIRSIVTRERLDRLNTFGTRRLLEKERAKAIRLAGGEDAVYEGIEVLAIAGTPGDTIIGAQLAYRGEPFTKTTYWVREDGAYRFSLRIPRNVESSYRTIDDELASVSGALSTSTYRIRNFSSTSTSAYRLTVNGSMQEFNIGTSVYHDKTADDSCDTFADGAYFAGHQGGLFVTNFGCDWQWTGDDFWRSSANYTWHCTDWCD